jgi:thiopurine S-methyltransferase
MEADFWHNMWETNKIGFHLPDTNTLLINNFSKLELTQCSRVFIPLCGKTHDIKWLLDKGYKVVGVELSQIAINDLFNSLDIRPTIENKGTIIHYSATNIDIYVGDIFELDKEILGEVDAIYDRAAIVALPSNLREKYTKHLCELTNNKKQLLITLDYNQSLRNGPPFSVPQSDIEKYYKDIYDLQIVEVQNEDGFKGVEIKERVWILTN